MKLLFKAVIGLALLPAMPVMAEGDAAQGKDNSAMCAACHGPDGNSTVAMWPKLAGQHEAYLERQLVLIKSGERQVPEMTGIASMLSEQDMADLAAYFAAQKTSPGVTDSDLLRAGERLYRAGNAESAVPACMACHGPAGEGNPLSGYPALAGQHSVYIGKMLTRFRAGDSWGEDDASSKVMVGVAEEMTDAEIEAVASYVQGLYSKETE